jgi:flagellin
MAITFNTNLAALGAQRNIGIASQSASSSLSKLSSGSRVPQAKDDAAGLAIGSKLKSEVAGLTQASNNAAQAISLLQIADGALSTLGDILQRMKALAVQSSSGQLADADRSLLNQEFTGLQSEVTRVATLTNFNGTTLLAGSTSVTDKTNNLGAYSATNLTTATNLVGAGAGFDDITFAQNFGDGAIKVDYNATGRVLTVKDLVNNKTQSITLATGAIAAGSTETYNFGDIGVKISLNSNFNKATNIAGANTSKATAAAGQVLLDTTTATAGLTSVVYTAASSTISAISLTGTGPNAISAEDLYGASAALSGAFTAVLAGNITVGTHTFISTSAAQTFGGAPGAKAFNFNDGQGNSFTLTLTTSTAATAGTATGTLKIGADVLQTNAGKIESSGTGVNAANISSVVEAAGALAFNFGNVDNALLNINAATANAATAAITINGVAFTNSATVDLTTTGVKSLTMADVNGNSFTVQFNVTRAFQSGANSNVKITLAQFGQVVAADSITSGSTTFDFKVGTGTSVNDKISFSLNSATATSLGINAVTIDTAGNADTAITALNTAINAVSSRRADIGAAQSRLDFASNNISVAIENTTAAASALLDVDVSAEITKFTNQNVLMQAGISLLGQANQQPALLLRLLQ